MRQETLQAVSTRASENGFQGWLRRLRASRLVFFVLKHWIPYRLLAARLETVSKDGLEMKVNLKPSWWRNINSHGTIFGGSLFSMCDPLYVVILSRALGPGYLVVDKEAQIRFLRPARSRVEVRIRVEAEMIQEIKNELSQHRCLDRTFHIQVRERNSQLVVAEVSKTVRIRHQA